MRFLYSWLIRCAVPFAYAAILWRALSDRQYWQGLAERLGFGAALPAPSIWLHAVSLGEMSAAAPLLRALRLRFPEIPLVVTTATPAGRARAAALIEGGADIRFLPYDTPGSVRRFLKRVRPRAAIIMETELWPNLLRECERRGIPVLLASARLSAKSVTQYRRFGSLFAGVFSKNLLVAAQSAEDAERFRSIGAAAERTVVVGNVKFDVSVDAAIAEAGRALRVAYAGTRPVWIAGSTHAGEEEQLLDAHALLLASTPNAVLLLVPRHKDRFAGVAELLARRGVKFARRSRMASGAEAPQLPSDAPVLLVDTVGELATLYASADVAFVGGSLVPTGGHNLLEPAALGLPVLTGPSYFNGKEIAQLLLARGAALEVKNAPDLAAVLQRLLAAPDMREPIGAVGKEIIAENRGSVAKLLALIEPWLPEAGLQPAEAGRAYR
ncbi:MAG TPA: lipid IV(A) 3-deoxy-D-manno-octulosonic acid transferase [Steroidobacteraceae bacterium]|jgi:3-deoxy-D-manno-octulosonic-acid transferase|nr:lipid IV(A) 3-deoxy-D-manno-octulosonic acid transferase [Steroidobacteraceae bacterium]